MFYYTKRIWYQARTRNSSMFVRMIGSLPTLFGKVKKRKSCARENIARFSVGDAATYPGGITRNRWTRHLERLPGPEQQPRFCREAVARPWRCLGSRGCGQGKRRFSIEIKDESGAGPEQPLDSEVHGPHTAYNQTALWCLSCRMRHCMLKHAHGPRQRCHWVRGG